MQKLLLGFFAFLLFGCASQASSASPTDSVPSQRASLPDLGPAPELLNATWLNVDAPLRLADLRGNVVLIDMWTFG
jgi:hypothetical protein